MATCDTPTLIAAACENKFTCLDQRIRRATKLQLLCNIVNSPAPAQLPAPNPDVTSGKVGGDLFGLGVTTDDPPEDNWEGWWSLTGTGNPTTDPSEWTQLPIHPGTTNVAMETGNEETPGNRGNTDWGAIRYRSGGGWSPWAKMTDFP